MHGRKIRFESLFIIRGSKGERITKFRTKSALRVLFMRFKQPKVASNVLGTDCRGSRVGRETRVRRDRMI